MKDLITAPNRKWFTAFVMAMVMLVAFTTLQTVLTLKGQVTQTNDQLQCVLYEIHAHRVEIQQGTKNADAEAGTDHNPVTRPSLTLPKKLKASCESILPGSTERGEDK